MQRHFCQREAAPESLSSSATAFSIPCCPHLSLRPHQAKQKLHTLRWFSTLHKLGQKKILILRSNLLWAVLCHRSWGRTPYQNQ